MSSRQKKQALFQGGLFHFSLFCVEGKAKEIYACDSSMTMIELAGEVFRKNGGLRVRLIGKHSSELRVPQDLPARVSLVVTETLDCGLLGEGILSTVAHAWAELLLPPPFVTEESKNRAGKFGFVIPSAAEIYVAGVECDDISDESHLKGYANLLNFKGCDITRNCENYDAINLKQLDYELLTDVQKLICVNFNEPQVVNEILRGHRDKKLKLRCVRAGRLDCFAVWFRLALDEDIALSTDPRESSGSAWDQAVFFPPRCVFLEKFQDVCLRVGFGGGKLKVEGLDSAPGTFEPSEEAVKILNDETLLKGFDQVQRKLLEIDRAIRILDFYPFPVFGLNFLTARQKSFDDELVCIIPTAKDRNLVDFLSKKYHIKNIDVLKEWNLEEFYNKKETFDVILVDFVEATGELKDGVVTQFQFLKALLRPEGIILPENVAVYGQLVYSDWLLRSSRVLNDEVTCNFKIKDLINVYQTRHFIDVNSKVLKRTACSDPFQLFNLLSPEMSTQISVQCISGTPAPNALIYWFKLYFFKECAEICTNSRSSMYHQAGFLFENFNFSDKVKLNVIRDDGLFNVELIKEQF